MSTIKQESKRAVRTDAAQRKLLDTVTQDSFQNFAAKLGIGADNLNTAATYGFNPITRQRTLLEWIHRGTWLGGVAIDIVADDMTRAGVEIQGRIKPDDMRKIETRAKTLKIWNQINRVIRWSRLYGGCIGVLLIDGQDVQTPLRPERIGRDAFKGILPLDRWQVEPDLNRLVEDFGPNLGLPKYYAVQSNAPAFRGKKIHYTRCIRLLGVDLPYQQSMIENLWGLSVLERLYDRMVAFDSATTGAAQLVHKAYLRTYKIKGLRDIVGLGGADALKGLTNTIDMMRRFQMAEGMTLMDVDDEFEGTVSNPFSGLSDALIQFGQQLGGALQIPLVRLFGQSPAGMNSTGESDLRMYYDGILQQQEVNLATEITTVYRALALSEEVKVKDDFGTQFKNLWQMQDQEKATIAGMITDTVQKAEEAGLVTRKTALMELKQSSSRTGVWSNISEEDISEAEADGPPLPLEIEVQQLKSEAAEQAAQAKADAGEDDEEEQPASKGKKSKDWKQDHHTATRRAVTLLAQHKERMDELIAQGVSPEEASKQAFKEVTAGGKGIAAGRKQPKDARLGNRGNRADNLARLKESIAEAEQALRFAKTDEENKLAAADLKELQSIMELYKRTADTAATKLAWHHGIQVVIETPAGTHRQGYGFDAIMPADYGYVRRAPGADGDELDCYVGPSPESPHVFVINQKDLKTGAFDEHKVMFGYYTRECAIEDYVLGYTDGQGAARLMSVHELGMPEFKTWIASGDTTQPFKTMPPNGVTQ